MIRPTGLEVMDAAIEFCKAHYHKRHVNLVPPCEDARRDAIRWADREEARK